MSRSVSEGQRKPWFHVNPYFSNFQYVRMEVKWSFCLHFPTRVRLQGNGSLLPIKHIENVTGTSKKPLWMLSKVLLLQWSALKQKVNRHTWSSLPCARKNYQKGSWIVLWEAYVCSRVYACIALFKAEEIIILSISCVALRSLYFNTFHLICYNIFRSAIFYIHFAEDETECLQI